MMNKKRLAVLAMSAVMTASTVSMPVNAADFTSEPVAQEADVDAQSVEVNEDEQAGVEAATYVTDMDSVDWNTETGKVTFMMVSSDGQGEPVKREEQGTKKPVSDATCDKPAIYQWTFKTDDGKELISGPVEEGTALGHNWQEKTEVISAGNCETGEPKVTRSGRYCDRCESWEAGYQETKSEADHSLDGKNIVDYVVIDNVIIDKDGNATLEDKTQDGSYDIVTSQTCKLCGKKVEISRENKKLESTDAAEESRTVVDAKNIKDSKNIIGKEVSELPSEDKILLEDCSKDGSYTVQVTGNNVNYKYDVTVKAHHVAADPTLEYVNAEDKGLLTSTVKDGQLIVANSSCVKAVDYYEVVKCASCGKEISKTKKTAEKSTNHIYDSAKKKEIEANKNTVKNVADLGADGKYIKVVPETATCEAAGTVTVEFYCKACGEKAATVTGVKVNALGHDEAYKVENEVDATCEKAGSYDLIKYCKRCGKELKKVTVTGKKLPHTNESAVGVNITDTDKNSDVFIDLVGNQVIGEYTKGQVIENVQSIGEVGTYAGAGILNAKVYSNCAVCHNHEVWLPAKNVTFTIEDVTKEAVDRNGYVTKAGTIVVGVTYTTDEKETITASTTLPYYSDKNVKIPENMKNGLIKDADGIYRYYINGDFAEDYAGVVEYGGGEFFVANGLLCKDANGLNLYDGTWYMLSGGQVQRGYNDLALYDGEWFYVSNGELNENVNGIVNYNGGQFLVINGRLGKEVNGLWQNIDGDWYYLANGQVQNQYTGVAEYDGAFFYVVNGILDSDYNGTVEYDGATFKVVNGMLQ